MSSLLAVINDSTGTVRFSHESEPIFPWAGIEKECEAVILQLKKKRLIYSADANVREYFWRSFSFTACLCRVNLIIFSDHIMHFKSGWDSF